MRMGMNAAVRWIGAGMVAVLCATVPGAARAQANPFADFLRDLFGQPAMPESPMAPGPGPMVRSPLDDPFGAAFEGLFGDEPALPSLILQRLDLQGAGCPGMDAVRAFLNDSGSLHLLRIQFVASPEGLQLIGGGPSSTRTCTVRARLEAESRNGPITVGLSRTAEGIRVLRPDDSGTVRVRTRLRIGDQTSEVTEIAFPQRPRVDLQVTGRRMPLLLQTETSGASLDVFVAIQLEINDAPNAALRVEELALELVVPR